MNCEHDELENVQWGEKYVGVRCADCLEEWLLSTPSNDPPIQVSASEVNPDQ